MTIVLNGKGGMDDKTFKNYVMNSIMLLYPDARDEPEKQVMFKIDSGTGMLDSEFLALLRFHGF